MKLSAPARQALLTLIKKAIVDESRALLDTNASASFFYELADKENAETIVAFEQLNYHRDVQRESKHKIQRLASLSKELKGSLRRPQTETSRAIAQAKSAMSKQWLVEHKQAQ